MEGKPSEPFVSSEVETLPAMSARVTLAAIAGAHGVRGEVRLKLFTDSLASLAAHEQVLVGGTPRRLLQVGGTAKSPNARLEGIADRSAAEALRGTLIEVERDALPPLGEGEYYHADLVGLPCVDGQGAELGTVAAVENFGAGDLLEVELPTGKRSLIPFKPGIADLEEGRVVLDPAFLA
jgi:16S rRNA processing protein RimM